MLIVACKQQASTAAEIGCSTRSESYFMTADDRAPLLLIKPGRPPERLHVMPVLLAQLSQFSLQLLQRPRVPIRTVLLNRRRKLAHVRHRSVQFDLGHVVDIHEVVGILPA